MKTKLDQATDIINNLRDALTEAHQDELNNDHYGDGPEGCTYCQAIEEAGAFLALNSDPDDDGNESPAHRTPCHHGGTWHNFAEGVCTDCGAKRETSPIPVARRIAIQFAMNLDADGINLKRVDSENVRNSPNVCASHDHCDANMYMAAAFASVVGREIDLQSDADTALWNEAWRIAKKEGFAALALEGANA